MKILFSKSLEFKGLPFICMANEGGATVFKTKTSCIICKIRFPVPTGLRVNSYSLFLKKYREKKKILQI